MKENGKEQALTVKDIAKMIAKDSGLGPEKWRRKRNEQYREPELARAREGRRNISEERHEYGGKI